MPAVQTPVDATKLLVGYLLGYFGTVPPYPGGPYSFDRIYGHVVLPDSDPSSPLIFPLVTLHTFGPGRDAIGHLDRPNVQFDVWVGDDLEQAAELVQTVRAAMTHSNIVGSHADGVVTGAQEITGPQPLFDQAEGRMRFTWIVQVFIHP